MEQPSTQQGNDNPTQQQAEDQPSQQDVEMVDVVENEDDSPGALLRKEADNYLSEMARTIRLSDFFCNDMQAAVNELSHFGVQQYIFVTQTCNHIKDHLESAKQQSEIYIYSEQDSPARTRDRILKMKHQLGVFRTHRSRVADLYLMQMPIPQTPNRLDLARNLVRHLFLLRDDVQKLLRLAKGELSVDEDQAQAAGQVAGPSQPAAHRG